MSRELVEIAEWAVNAALRAGADQADVFLIRQRALRIEGSNEKRTDIRQRRAEEGISQGANIRVVIDKRVAYSYATSIEREDLLRAIEMAISTARAKRPDPDFVSLPSPKAPAKVQGLVDDRMKKPPIDDLFDEVRKCLKELEEAEPRYCTISAGYGFSILEVAIANSLGVEAYYEGTTGGVGVYMVAEEGGIRASSFESISSRKFEDLDLQRCMDVALKYIKLGLKPIKLEPGEKKVLFEPWALSSLIANVFIPAINAYNIQEGKSYLAGKLGVQVASEKLTIIDDGTMPGGLMSTPVDGEGVPSRRTVIIENGVLKSYLYDSYTAFKEGRESTGNASRSLRGAVSIGPRNHILQGETCKLDELMESIEEGVLARMVMGAHSSNVATGAFSVVITPAYVIKNGELIGAWRGCLISGTFQELLQRYVAQGDDTRQIGFLVAPSVLFEGLKVTT